MPDVSIPLWRVIELTGDAGDGLKLGMDIYPIFDETERLPLNRKIIDHFWMRQIGFETISLFTHFMRAKMNEIMPMYNKLYLSERIQFDPLATFSLETVRSGAASEQGTRTATGSNQSDTTGTSHTSGSTLTDSTSGSRTVSGSTPQNPLSGSKDYASQFADVNAKTHATGSNTSDTTTTGSETGSNTGNESSTGSSTTSDTSRTTGFQGSAADLLTRYRSTILNIDMLVIDELPELFSLLWSTEDRDTTIWSYRR